MNVKREKDFGNNTDTPVLAQRAFLPDLTGDY